MAESKKRKRRSTKSPKTFSMGGVANYAKKGAALVAGIAVGTMVQKFVQKKDAVSGTDLLGLDGTSSKFVVPAAMIGVGLVTHAAVKNDTLKTVALGIGAAGGVNLVNAIAGETKIALSGNDDDKPLTPIMPGVGDPVEITNYDQLPDNNELQVVHPDPSNMMGADADYSLVNGLDIL